jgi:hypothetical protein
VPRECRHSDCPASVRTARSSQGRPVGAESLLLHYHHCPLPQPSLRSKPPWDHSNRNLKVGPCVASSRGNCSRYDGYWTTRVESGSGCRSYIPCHPRVDLNVLTMPSPTAMGCPEGVCAR